jgi:hypothetical protein
MHLQVQLTTACTHSGRELQMAKGSLEISIYGPPAAVSPPSAPNDSSGGRHKSPRTVNLFAATASLALHVLVLTFVILGGEMSRAKQADVPGAATEAVAMQWVNLEETSRAGLSDGSKDNITSGAFSDPPLQSIKLSELPTEIRANYPRPGNEKTGGEAPAPVNLTGEMAERSTVNGLYIRQIKAQIDRAWLRPRIPLDVPLFSCRARIAQDSTGTVREVTLELCTADARWQQSLVRAIQSASPLPAPPDPSIFTSVLRISFESESYAPTAYPEQSEPSPTGSSDQPPALPTIQRNPGA